MAIRLFDEVIRELKEAAQENWDIKDCIPVMAPQDGGSGGKGDGQQGKVPGEDESEQPSGPPGDFGGKGGEMTDPNDIPDPNGTGGGEGDDQGDKGDEKGEGEGEGEEKGDEEKESNKGGSSSDKNTSREWMDDHSRIEKGDNTAKSIVNAAYKDVESDYRRMQTKSVGSGVGALEEKIKKYTKVDFDISQILSRFGTFKRKLSEYYKRLETYGAAVFNPVTSQTTITAPGKIREKQREKKSALLIFAVDTSGSITSEDYKLVFGYLQDIATKFEKREYGVDGEVMLISWDTAVHGPMKEFRAVKGVKPGKDLTDEEREQMKLKGGGGTDVQNLFDYLDNNFVKEIDGESYFVFSDKMEALTGKKSDEEVRYTVKTKLKPLSDEAKVPSWKESDFKVPSGQLNLIEGGFSNIPFLIIYTDGWFSEPAAAQSKLFGNNLGNVLYIVTDRGGIKNIRPKNYVYHNLREE